MMFGLTKREQRWAAEQKAAETIVPLLTAAIEARTAMDTNDRIAALERGLTQAVQMYTDAAGERDKAIAAEIKAEADKWAAVRACVDVINCYSYVGDRSKEMLVAVKAEFPEAFK